MPLDANHRRSFDVLIIGAGPSWDGGDGFRLGSWADRRAGRRQPRPRRPDLARRTPPSPAAPRLRPFGSVGRDRRLRSPARHPGRRSGRAPGLFWPKRAGQLVELSYGSLILATAPASLFLPFPGWTLPNVLGAGGLQALVKSGLPIAGKSVVVAGSGPLLLAVGAHLKKKGAVVRGSSSRLRSPGLSASAWGSGRSRERSGQAIDLRRQIGDRPLPRRACWPVEAIGDEFLSAGHAHRRPVDLVGRLRLPRLRLRLGAEPGTRSDPGLSRSVRPGHWWTYGSRRRWPMSIARERRRESVGLDLSLVEGKIAGLRRDGTARPGSSVVSGSGQGPEVRRRARSLVRPSRRAAPPCPPRHDRLPVRGRAGWGSGRANLVGRCQAPDALRDGPVPGADLWGGHGIPSWMGAWINPITDLPGQR